MGFLLLEKLQNLGKSCLAECKEKSGHCGWCGTEGLCCKRDGNSINGCDGFIGGVDYHECAKEIKGKLITLQNLKKLSLLFLLGISNIISMSYCITFFYFIVIGTLRMSSLDSW